MLSEKKKILVLWNYRGLITNLLPKEKQNFPIGQKKNDLYIRFCQALIDYGLIDGADLIWIDKSYKKKIFSLEKNIKIHVIPKINDCFKTLKQKYYLLFIRGNFKEYLPIIKKSKREITLFYAADSEFIPRFIQPKNIDIIFVDDPYQVYKVNKKYPKIISEILDKPADNEYHLTDSQIKKQYDICYIANFVPWKNHNLLFGAIDRLSDRNKIKCICVGNTFSRDSEIKIMAWKYHTNLILTGPLKDKETRKIIRQSKIGVIMSEKDANPRTLTEMIACGTPVLVNKNLTGGLHLINRKTGKRSSLDKFSKHLKKMLNNYQKYKPEEYYKKYLTMDKVIERCFIKPIQKLIKISTKGGSASGGKK